MCGSNRKNCYWSGLHDLRLLVQAEGDGRRRGNGEHSCQSGDRWLVQKRFYLRRKNVRLVLTRNNLPATFSNSEGLSDEQVGWSGVELAISHGLFGKSIQTPQEMLTARKSLEVIID